jgi:ribosomal-protein-alanine N-acetyltransferase
LRLILASMELEDIAQVLEVDRESYSLPWPASAYRREVLHNRNARYVVLREVVEGEEIPRPQPDPRPRLPFPFIRWPHKSNDSHTARQGRILGYAGMWLMVDEAHITTIAMRTEWRGHGLGELLLISLVEAATDVGAHRVTLEVRVSNEVAQNLYHKYGFRREGVRPRYYSDNNEDAYIMTTDDIRTASFREIFLRALDRLRGRLSGIPDMTLLESPLDRGQQASVPQEAEQA